MLHYIYILTYCCIIYTDLSLHYIYRRIATLCRIKGKISEVIALQSTYATRISEVVCVYEFLISKEKPDKTGKLITVPKEKCLELNLLSESDTGLYLGNLLPRKRILYYYW